MTTVPTPNSEAASTVPARKRRTGPPAWLTAPCPGWCLGDIDHDPQTHPDDRHHLSATHAVQLHAMDYTNFATPTGHEYHPRSLMASLTQHYREAEPRISLGDDSTLDWWVYLTLDEAHQHAVHLMDLVMAGRTGKDLDVSAPGGAAEHRKPWCVDHSAEDICHARDIDAAGSRVGLTHEADEGTVVWLNDTDLTPDRAEEIAMALLVTARRAREASK